MKTNIIKLSSALILSGSLLLGATTDEKVTAFLKSTVSSNSGYTVKDVSIKNSVKLDNVPNWKAYFINIKLHVNKENRDVSMTDVIFSDGNVMSKDLMDLGTRASLKSKISVPVSPKLYNKEHLIAGNANAKNKLIVFSDPVCPFCIDYLPTLIQGAKSPPEEFALYYYDFPLGSIHPRAPGFTKAMLVAEKQGIKDVQLKTYKDHFSYKVPTEDEIVKQFNTAFGTNITVKQMNEAWVLKKMSEDEQVAKDMMINGTPTVFVNGEKDTTRAIFKNLLAKANK